MLDGLRSHAGGFGAKILLGFLVLTFAIWGVGDMVRRPNHAMSVASVGSKTITLNDFQQGLRRETDNVRRALGDRSSPEFIKSLRLPHRVLQRLIDNNLIKLESQSMGLVPSDADVVKHIRANPSFQDSKGNFDKKLFEGLLRNAGMSEKTYVEQQREDLASSLVTDALSAMMPVPDAAVRTLFESHEEQRTAMLYKVSPSDAGTIPAPSQAEIETYYKQHVHEFSAPEYRTVSYVSFKSDDVHPSASSNDAELKAAYEDRIDEFKKPELRVVDMLLYNSQDKANKAYTDLKAGADFAQVVKTSGVQNKNTTSLGAVDRSHIVEAAEDAVFSLKPGEITTPIESPFGWHVFRVTKIEAPAVASFDEAKPMLEKDAKQHATDEALNKLANTLEDALAGGNTLQEAAGDLGLKVHKFGPVDRQGISPDGAAAKDAPDFDKFMDVAFKTEEKTESSLTTTKGGVYYIVRVDSVTPERARTLDEVKALVIAGWQNEARAERLTTIAGEVAKKFADKNTRDAVIAQYKLKGELTAPFKRSSQTAGAVTLPPMLVDSVFSIKPNEATTAFPARDGDYLIAVVKDIIPATLQANNPKQDKIRADIQQDLSNTLHNEITSQYMRYLAKKYPVTINENVLDAITKDAADSDAPQH